MNKLQGQAAPLWIWALACLFILLACIGVLYYTAPGATQPSSSAASARAHPASPVYANAAPRRDAKEEGTPQPSCSSSPGGGGGQCASATSNVNLMPVNDADHNLREIVKQLLLLEDHMFQEDKQCRMCIAKHMLTVEALAEGGVTLCRNSTDLTDLTALLTETARSIRETHAAFVKAHDPAQVRALAQDVRALRRRLMEACHVA